MLYRVSTSKKNVIVYLCDSYIFYVSVWVFYAKVLNQEVVYLCDSIHVCVYMGTLCESVQPWHNKSVILYIYMLSP